MNFEVCTRSVKNPLGKRLIIIFTFSVKNMLGFWRIHLPKKQKSNNATVVPRRDTDQKN